MLKCLNDTGSPRQYYNGQLATQTNALKFFKFTGFSLFMVSCPHGESRTRDTLC